VKLLKEALAGNKPKKGKKGKKGKKKKKKWDSKILFAAIS
jgi:hypothetical protein